MTDLLLRFLGIKATGAGHLTQTSVVLHGIHPLWVFLAALALGGLAIWLYRRIPADVSAVKKYAMTAFRLLFLALILGLLLRPVLSITFEHIVRRSLIVLLDTSGSMSQIRDQRTDDNDLKRVAIARGLLDPALGLNQPINGSPSGLAQASRLEVVRSALRNPRLDLLARLARDYDLSVFTFDRDLAEIPAAAYRADIDADGSGPRLAQNPELNLAWVDKLEAAGPLTKIGDSVRDVISRKRGQPMAGIVLITDGASNSGLQPVEAARLAAQDRVPLYIWGVGITSPKDIILARSMFAPEVAFARDEVPVSVRVRSMGMAGQSATLVVRLGEDRAEKEIEFNADGEQVVTVTLTPRTKGEFDILASIAPREDEVVKENNSASQHIRIIDDKIKVLMVEQSPRWEFRYMQAILMRDRRVQLKCVLLEADPSVLRDRDSPYLSEFPRAREDLFKYDCVILGDVDARVFSPEQLAMLGEFVSKFGGSMIMVAGKRFAPQSYRRTVVEKMLPVEMESADMGGPVSANRPFRVELTSSGKSSLMLRLAERELDSYQRWAAMPPLYWAARVARAKPAADVLVVDPDPSRASRYGKMPIIASQQYGMGQVLYVGTDNLWRWRRNAGDTYHSMFWGQVVQRMALPHLLGASRRTQLTSDQKEYTTGAKATIYARLYTEAFEPMTEPVIKGFLADAAGQSPAREVLLRAMPEQPGMYRGELIAPAAGLYLFVVDHDRATKLEFTITEPKAELTETAMNESLLKEMARASARPGEAGEIARGEFFREETLNALPDRIREKAELKRSTLEIELWSSPMYFLLMMVVVTAEWIVRKTAQLK